VTTSLTFSDSILITATPEEVYAVVSDVTRTGEWSPICQECWWDEGAGPRVGARFTGRNVTDDRTWETRCEVTAAAEGAEFGWSVNDGKVEWRYSMRGVGGGTELTESWEFTPAGQASFVERYGEDASTEIAARTETARVGIRATLAAMKRIIERA
jgi:ribosome-associated toxin RatA of RatAB toxin-antitoxin module